MNLVLIGQTGSGKTTLAKELEIALGLPRISSGDIARELAASDAATDLALRQGAFAPEQAMRARIRQEIEAAEVARGGWILDGFPRMVEQLICLNQWTASLPTFILMDTSLWTCIERLTARGREGDNPDAIARKMASYISKTEPMIEILDSGGILHALHADTISLDAMVGMVERIVT